MSISTRLVARLARTLGPVLLLSSSLNLPHPAIEAAAGKTLYYYSGQTLDLPGPAESATSSGPYGAVFDTLFSPDQRDRLQPDLALAADHSPDWLTWTLHLRHGVQWADGQPFTSADVAYSYRAIVDPAHSNANTAGWDHIDRLTTPDRYTVVCHLRSTYGPFLNEVGFGNVILPQHVFDKAGIDYNAPLLAAKAIGTGPYTIAAWDPNTAVTLVPNPHSWRGQPAITQIQIKSSPVYTRTPFRAGDSALSFEQAAPYPVLRSGYTLYTYDANTLLHVELKQWGFLRDRLVRQALDYATPKETVTRLGAAAYADVDPAMIDFYDHSLPRHAYSLATAAALLARDGFIRGPGGILRRGGQPLAIGLDTTYSPSTGGSLALAMARSWGLLGIKVAFNATFSGYGSPSGLFGSAGPQFTPGMTAIVVQVSNGNDPDDSYYWNSASIPKQRGGFGNVVAFFHPFAFQTRIDALTNAGLSAPDPASRRLIYAQIQSLVANEVPWIFVRWLPYRLLAPSGISGIQPNGFNNLFWNVAAWRVR